MAQQHPTAVPDGLALDREPQPGAGAPGENGAGAVTRPYDAGLPPEPDVEPLLKRVRQRNPRADTAAVGRAFELARERHAGKRRASGVPALAHPLGVATVVADLGLDAVSVEAALLHDAVEEGLLSREEIGEQFGPEVAKISEGLGKLDRIGYEGREAAQAEIIRKMVIAMARDIRVLVIKLADRLHNMREVLEIYAPLANRLGIHQIKWELEDLAFATLYPLRYEEIARMTAERQPAREQYVAEVIEQVNAQLKLVKLRAVVSGRPKHYYSIYEKMVVRGKEFTDIFDLVGVRILVDSIKDCYAALGQVHAVWKPVPGRFKDYIAMPKFNLYQSLHTTVVGPQGKPLEIQIRTKAMHRTAEYGVAAHWRYKTKDGKPATEQEMGWLRQLIDWQRELSDPRDFIENLDTDLYVDEVFVFTPKGDVIQLPAGATPIDFAYAVHTEVGHRCVGARVNKRLVPLEHALENGDNVEIFTSKAQDAGPSRDWLGIVRTPRARNKIRQWFAKERREDAIEAGKDALVRAMRKAGLPLQKLTQGGALTALAADMRFASLEAFYAAVGSGQTSAQAVVSRLQADLRGEEQEDDDDDLILERTVRQARPQPATRGVVVKGVDDVWVKLARCCTPVPRDPIIGFVTRGHGVSVHRGDCPNADNLRRDQNRIIEVEWDTSGPSVFAVTIQVEALDRTKLLRDITEVLSDHHVNIMSANVATGRDRVATLRFTFELADISHLAHVLSTVKKVEGVYDAFRVVPHAQNGNGDR
jgi:guanosine-3',5'-bis(diphosphate) 3'-pyrophosphohydrolase